MFQKIFTSSLLLLIAMGGFFVSVAEKESGHSSTQIVFVSETYAECFWADGTNTVCTDNISANQNDGSYDKVEAARLGRQGTPAQSDNDVKKMMNTLVAGLNIALSVVTIIVSPAVMLAGWLMSPDWTSGDLFGLRPVMYKLWITVSNITYFIYAILLIFIALATIFGKDNFGYKAMLPKLALGIIMVPFTWWFVQFTISLASTVTASVISIPEEALSSVTTGNTWWTSHIIPMNITIDENSALKDSTGNKDMTECAKTPSKCITPQTMLKNTSGMYGHMLVYAYGVFKLGDVKKLDNATDVATSIVKLIHDGLVSVIMLVVFGLLTLALIFMLMARAVMLWVYTIFSPFMTLELVMGWLLKKVSDDFNMKQFVWLAFVPALVWLSLSFWLVVIAAIQWSTTTGSNNTCNPEKLMWDGCIIASLMGNPENKITRKLIQVGTTNTYTTVNEVKIGGITFTFKWKIWGTTDTNGEATSIKSTTSVLSSAGGIFGTIIVDIIALLFIWMAFMAAKWVSKVVDAAVKPFEDMGKKIGGLAASLPKYTPLPLPGGSVAGIQKTVEMWSDKFKTVQDQKINDNIWKTFPWLVKWVIQPKDMEELTHALHGVKSDSAADFKKVSEATAKVQSKAEYTSANYETIRQPLKQTGWTDANIANHLTTKGIIDTTERELLTKLYKWVEWLSDNEKKKIWDLNQSKFGSWNSKKDASSANFATRIWSSDTVALEFWDQTIQVKAESNSNTVVITEENLKKLEGKSAWMTKTQFKNNLLKVMKEEAANDLVSKISDKYSNFFAK